MAKKYAHGWDDYIDGLVGPGDPPGLDRGERAEIRRTYYTSAAVLKASEDKTFPGAVVGARKMVDFGTRQP